MQRSLDPFRFLAGVLAGWANQQQQHAIEYLREENCVLREQLAGKRIRYTDDQRRRLAEKAKTLGRKALEEIATLVRPETLLAWHRKLIAQKYDGSREPDARGSASRSVCLSVTSTWNGIGFRKVSEETLQGDLWGTVRWVVPGRRTTAAGSKHRRLPRMVRLSISFDADRSCERTSELGGIIGCARNLWSRIKLLDTKGCGQRTWMIKSKKRPSIIRTTRDFMAWRRHSRTAVPACACSSAGRWCCCTGTYWSHAGWTTASEWWRFPTQRAYRYTWTIRYPDPSEFRLVRRHSGPCKYFTPPLSTPGSSASIHATLLPLPLTSNLSNFSVSAVPAEIEARVSAP